MFVYHLLPLCLGTLVVDFGDFILSGHLQGPHITVGACGKPSNWSTWWILDGSDDADSLRSVDVRGKLNDQLSEVLKIFQPWNLIQPCVCGNLI